MNCGRCGVYVPQPSGKHGPRRYCELHRPRNAAAANDYYVRNRVAILAAHRARDGAMPLQVSACADCGATFRHYPGAILCRPCRSRARAILPPVVDGPCLECSGPVPPYSGRHRARTYCSTRCRNRAAEGKRGPRHRATRTQKGTTP